MRKSWFTALDELARYVDLNEPALKKNPPIGIGSNVETFDRLRRWAYVAVAHWRSGTYEAWYGAVADVAADVGSRGSAEVVCDRGFGALYKRCGFNRPALDLVEHIS